MMERMEGGRREVEGETEGGIGGIGADAKEVKLSREFDKKEHQILMKNHPFEQVARRKRPVILGFFTVIDDSPMRGDTSNNGI